MKIKLLLFSLLLGFVACSDSEDFSSIPYNNYDSNDTLSNSSEDLYGEQAEQYQEYIENDFIAVNEVPVSTFSVDADGASYANVRRFLNDNSLPPKGAVRIEELINYFPLDYKDSNSSHPISLNGELSACPWTPENKLVRIGIKGESISNEDLLPSNIVLLIDVSGSMNNELPLLKEGFKTLVDGFDGEDRIAIVTYAGEDKVVLESTSGYQKQQIKNAIDQLGAGGGTSGAAGIETAYEIALDNFITGGNNRVIIGTDGDFNIGPSSTEEIIQMIEEKRDLGVFITVLGLGSGNYNDAMLEQLADKGNGTYEYIDNLEQAEKVFVEDFGKFYTVAKDVKVQVEFNPETVEAYRLIGYENRLLNEEDFEDDSKDAGEIGSSQNITALYEIVPAENADNSLEVFKIDFRYKTPEEDQSIPMSLSIKGGDTSFEEASEDHRFVSCVAGFGMLLIESEHKGNLTFDDVINWTNQAQSFDPSGHRSEFVSLIQIAKSL